MPVASKTDAVVVSCIAKDFAARAGLSTTVVAQVALAAGELASNCWRHGGGGRVELRVIHGVLEVRAIDSGPGIEDPARAQQDGVSRGLLRSPTTLIPDGLGAGLGSVRRLMDEVQILSQSAVGTIVIARKHLRGHVR